MDELELDGVHAEIERLAALHQARKPVYSDRFLSRRTPGTEHLGAPEDVRLTHDDLLAAQRELAEERGVSSAQVRGLVLLTAAQAGLGHSEQEQAAVIAEVAAAMAAGKTTVSGAQILALSRLGDSPGAGAEDVPVPDEDAAATVALSQETAAMALSAGQDSPEAVIGRHPELAHLFRAGRTSSGRHPRKSGPGHAVTSASRAHASDLQDDPRDTDQPAKGGVTHRGVREILRDDLAGVFMDSEARDHSAREAWPS